MTTPQIHLLAPADIDAHALPRDRSALEPQALAELEASISQIGLRQPIEVFALRAPPPDGPRHGLISGLRRLTAFTRLHGAEARIPAFITTPADLPDAIARMLAENEIRAQITPWEKGRILSDAVANGVFDTLDAAVQGLYPALDRQRRARLRALAEVVAELGEGVLTNPEALSQSRLLRLGTPIRRGFLPLMLGALEQSRDRSPQGQWRILEPIIEEAEEAPRRRPRAYRPGRPRRMIQPRAGLWIRREKTREGWNLRFTGPDASGPLMEEIMDYVEQMFGTQGEG